jgi:hypothetical protein
MHLSDKDKHWLTVKGMGGGGAVIVQTTSKQAGGVILISDEVDFIPKLVRRDNDGSLHMNTENNPSRQNNNPFFSFFKNSFIHMCWFLIPFS